MLYADIDGIFVLFLFPGFVDFFCGTVFPDALNQNHDQHDHCGKDCQVGRANNEPDQQVQRTFAQALQAADKAAADALPQGGFLYGCVLLNLINTQIDGGVVDLIVVQP